ncbi:MAG: branched-chain amino acid ABC transporter substrate-binding protein [Chloroflexota bacterium]|nr:MAG: branched-chain amino acid ABC transporter substrate-binding protein [Chloroflexota bacterium]UCF28892.1 MAG: branched-chain amino acid ABC transporter substrate-binding protein [Chloroflexota bacterium]
MNKKVFAILSLLIFASMILVACAPAATEAPAEEPPAEEPPAEEPPAEEAFECDDAIGCVELAPDDPVHIASMLTISGATSFLGEDSVGAIEIAIDDRGGTLLGRDIQYTSEDSLCSAEGGQTAATKVASDPTILGVIGTNCSAAMTAAMDTISSAGLSILSPSNTAPTLTLDDPAAGGTFKPGYFRICHTDFFQGAVAGEFAYNELGARTLATIHDGSPYADQLQEVMANRFMELGGEVTFQGAVNVGDTDMRAVLTSVAADSPDALYFPIFEPEGPFIVAQSSEIAGLENTILIGADGLLVDSFPENSGPNAVGMYLTGPFVTGAAYDEFLAKWDAKFGGVPPSGFHAFAYDGTNILFDAIEAVAVTDADGTTYVGRQALRDAIKATADYDGVSGKVDCSDKQFGEFTSKGDCATGEALGVFEITEAEVDDGNWPPEVIYTP